MFRHGRHILALAAALAGPAFAGTADAADCLSPNQARAAAQQGQIMPMSSLIGSIKAAAGGEILPPPQLCQSGGRYVYIVNVLQPNGQVKRITVDAASGNIIGR
jgi:uncharacterized membrane protein YkoI